MMEIMLPKWCEMLIGFLIMGGLLVGAIVSVCYQDQKKKYEENDYTDLKKMMPKLPKEEKKK